MKDDRLYLMHIQEACSRIAAFTSDGEESFLKDLKAQDAVLRNFQVIGEAAKKVSADLKLAHPAIPWRAMTGMRDKLVHDYFGVNLNLVWQTVVEKIPALHEGISNILLLMSSDGTQPPGRS